MSASRIEDLSELAGFGGAASAEDKDLTLAFQRGDKGAYQAIYDRHSQRVHSICRRMLGQPDDAQEAAQETFLKIYQALGKFNGRYQLGPWIARIATNVCLDHLRARSRHPAAATPLEVMEQEPNGNGEEHDPEVLFMRHAEGRRVRKVLAGLPPLHRAAIVLRDFEGLSYEEVGIVLGITDCQVKALLHRARKRFKRSWTGLASILLPWRLVQRVRDFEGPARDQASQLVTSTNHVAASCSALFQQCGQYVADRAVGVVATVTLGVVAASAGGASTGAEPRSAETTIAATESSQRVLGSIVGRDEKRHRGARASKKTAATNKDVAPTPEEAPPPSEPTPTPAPPPSQQSGGAPTSGTPSPQPTPTPPPEPSGFSLTFSSDGAAPAEPCDCLWATEVTSESVTVSETGMYGYSQTLRGTAQASGADAWGLSVQHSGANGAGHRVRFFLYTKEGSYGYDAAGGLSERVATEWGGWSYTYRGTYKVYSRPGGSSEAMPESGSYVATVVFSWRQGRVVSSSFTLTQGS